MSDTTKYTPYEDSYGKTIVMHHLYLKPPLDGLNDDKQLSENLTLGELRESAYILPREQDLFYKLPVDARLVQAFQILRDAHGKGIRVNSSFRSRAYELSKGRSGNSQHVQGKAFDLASSGLVELVKEAVQTKNKLYKRLRAVGVNGIGIYEDKNFIHIDTRDPKADGSLALWFSDEKKNDDVKQKNVDWFKWLKALGVGFGIFATAVGLFQKFKGKKKK